MRTSVPTLIPASATVSEPVLVSGQFAAADASPALAAAVGWLLVALVVGSVLVLGRPTATQAIRDELADRLAVTFAVGFVVLFGLLVGSSIPFVVGVSLAVSPLATLGAVIAIPGLLVCVVLGVLGGCFGLVAAGDRISSRLGADETGSPWIALVLGTVVLGTTQLVPILGALVTIGLAIVGTGAVVLVRWGDSRWIAAIAPASKDGADEDAARRLERLDSGGHGRGHDRDRDRDYEHGWIAEAESTSSAPQQRTAGERRDADATWAGSETGTWAETGFRTDATAADGDTEPEDEPHDQWSDDDPFRPADRRADRDDGKRDRK